MSTLGEANRASIPPRSEGDDQPAELSLRTIIDASARLDELGTARLISQAAGVTHAARAAGKSTELAPEQIAVLADGSIRVDALPAGTSAAAYSAPEQLKNQTSDRRSDVFALGVILWEALTHTRLFEGATHDAIAKAVYGTEIRPPSESNANVPAELDAICRKALARDPADRYQSCKVMAAEIDAVLDDASYPDDNSQIAAYAAKLLARAHAPKLPAPKVAPKIEPKVEAKVAKLEPTINPIEKPPTSLPISPTASAIATLKGASAVRDVATPSKTLNPMAQTMIGTAITPTTPAPPAPVTPPPQAPAAPVEAPVEAPVMAATTPLRQAAPVEEAPVMAAAAPATNLRSTVIGSAAPPGIELLRAAAAPIAPPNDPRSTPAIAPAANLRATVNDAPIADLVLPNTDLRDTVKDSPAPALMATMQGFSLGPVPGSDVNAHDETGPMLLEAPPATSTAPPTPASPPSDPESFADTAMPHPAAAVSLPRKDTTGEVDVISRWAWSSESMPAIVDEPEEESPNRKLLFYAIGGALGVALLVSIIAFAAGGSDDDKKPVDAKAALNAANKPTEFKPLGADGEPTPDPKPIVDPTAGSAKPEPAITPEPITPEPAIVKPEPIKPEPIKPEPAIVKPEPAIVKPEPVKPEPKVIAKPEPKVIAKKPEPKVIATKPEPKVVAKKPEPKKPDPKVIKNPKPIDPYADTPVVAKRVDPVEAYRTGLQQYAKGDTTGALATFKASLQSNANFAPTYRGLGMVYEKLGQKAAARNAFKRYLQLAPNAGDSVNIKERMDKL